MKKQNMINMLAFTSINH